jgi:hypothetical protein
MSFSTEFDRIVLGIIFIFTFAYGAIFFTGYVLHSSYQDYIKQKTEDKQNIPENTQNIQKNE